MLDPAARSPDIPVATTVAEATPCTPRPERHEGARLNILLPSINAEHYFGGIHTAVLLYRSLCRHFPQSRIVLVDVAPDAEALARFDDHSLVGCDNEVDSPRQIVAFNDRYGRTLPVRPGDVWLATAWWTAYAAQRLAAWQGEHFGEAGTVTYLIQDFEPGFYPWSSQSAMALSTYRPERDVAVFNTQSLADYFQSQGLGYRTGLVFEPTLNDGLRPALEDVRRRPQPRVKRMVVYARPSTPRNAFELLCEGLRAWGWSDPHACSWEVVAPGEILRDVDLGPLKMRALGKLRIDEYAALLATSAVGVSLMVSPHPSYPPLEMAAFGMGVVTNRYAGKDLSSWSHNIYSIAAFTPEALARAMTEECARWREHAMQPYAAIASDHSFVGRSELDAIGDRVALLLAGRRGVP
jgi:hypothetical protein